jgi:hypothetical protein
VITDDQLRALRDEAERARDWAQIKICDAALRGSESARRRCEEVIEAARAAEDDVFVGGRW